MQTIIEMLHLKIVHHFLNVRQKLMTLLMKQIIFIAILMYNLIEYSDNYSDASTSLWQFKSDYLPVENAHLNTNNSQSLNPNKTGVFERSFFLVGWGWGLFYSSFPRHRPGFPFSRTNNLILK